MPRQPTNILSILLLTLGLWPGCGGPPAPRAATPAVRATAPAPASPAATPAVRPGAADLPGEDRIPPGPLHDALTTAGIAVGDIKCSTRVSWETSLNKYAKMVVKGLAQRWGIKTPEGERRKEVHFVLGHIVRVYFEQARPHNLGGMRLKERTYLDSAGVERPLMVFRSGITLQEGGGTSACFQSLLETGKVQHVVNLYAGSFPFHDLIDAEKLQAKAQGANYFDLREHSELRYRAMVEEEPEYEKNRAEAQRRLATLIRSQILQPKGAPPRGNIYFHCAGGMHRSGILFGVLQRCVNGASMEDVTDEYRRHVDWVSHKEPGGFEPLNLRFIREFDCSLLKSPQGK